MRTFFLYLTVCLLAVPACTSSMLPNDTDNFAEQREAMVAGQIEARGVKDPAVLAAMRKVPRHLFVPPAQQSRAYNDSPLPIGHNQTISQPYIVAYMTEAAQLSPDDKVLEIGTGSGYQAAVLAEIVKKVYSIEIVEGLARDAEERLSGLGYENIAVKHGDGYEGWWEHAPFDAIIVTAAPPEIPRNVVHQLSDGARMIVPVGIGTQELLRLKRIGEDLYQEKLLPVRFVPMIKGTQAE